MGKKIIIAEKPSVGQTYAETLGVREKHNGYLENEEWIVTWTIGHLVTLSYPEDYDSELKNWKLDTLPFLPENYKYKVISNVKSQFEVVKKLYNRNDIDCIYYAGDAAREGLYIQMLVRQMAGHKTGIEEKVVWIDSQTKSEILRGIREAKPLSAYRGMKDSGYIRGIEDYAMGINFSRALSLMYGNMLNVASATKKYKSISVGRVMTCVLGMIVTREYEITKFKPTPFYKVHSVIAVDGTEIEGEWRTTEESKWYESLCLYENNGFLREEDAKAFLSELPGEIIVKSIEEKTEKNHAPLLFNLAELQNECSKKLKINPTETLNTVQSLYEKKLTTYPRTDARVLSTAIAKEIDRNIKKLSSDNTVGPYVTEIIKNGWYKELEKTKYVDDSKITDHYAIIPTGDGNKNDLTDIESKVYDMILKRFVAIFYPPAEYAKITVEEKAGTESFFFTGRYLQKPGYLEIYGPVSDDNAEKGKAVAATELKEGETYATTYSIRKGETTAPKRYTSGSIILAMENAGKLIEEEELRERIKSIGIGTSATRDETIKKLCELEYIRIDKKTQVIYPEPLGFMVYETVNLTVPTLLSPKMTASWEKGLDEIVKGNVSKEQYQSKLNSYIEKQVMQIKTDDKTEMIAEVIKPFVQKGTNVEIGKEISGVKCPVCGGIIKTSRYGYSCENYKKEGGCTFGVGQIAGITLSEAQLKCLLIDKRTGIIKGFKSKNGKKFEAYLVLDAEHKVQFEFPRRNEPEESKFKCRNCGKALIQTRWDYNCGCGLKIPKELCGRLITEQAVKQLLDKGITTEIKGFKSKSGKPFKAKLALEGNKVQFKF